MNETHGQRAFGIRAGVRNFFVGGVDCAGMVVTERAHFPSHTPMSNPVSIPRKPYAPKTHNPDVLHRVALERSAKLTKRTATHRGQQRSTELADGHHPRELVNAVLAPLNRHGDELGPVYRVLRFNPGDGNLIVQQLNAPSAEHTIPASVVYDWLAMHSIYISAKG